METDSGAFHEVGTVVFKDDGPSHIEVSVSRSSIGPTAGEWLVSTMIFPHPDAVDLDDPDQFDAEYGEILPESGWEMSPETAMAVSDMYRRAAEQAHLFQSMD